MERKLAAILYADVAGYSRLTGVDDEGTVEILKVHLGAFKKAIEEHGGRIVNTAGDAVLAEFASVVTALKCAVEAQRNLAERNKQLPENRKLQFRVGVNLGDLVVDGDEIYGDGVNVAARLEALAKPGGICISGRVEEQVEDKVDVGFTYLGAQSVKNIKKPVNVYKVLVDRKDAGKIIGAPKPQASGRGWITAAVLALIIGAGGWAAWLHVNKPAVTPASIEKMAFPLPDKPSIAVLAFDNFSGDKQDDLIAKGLTEDIITALSNVPGLFVISRVSSFAFKDKSVTVTEIAEELGVRYVLEGSIQRSGDKLRVNAQLTDALSGHHLWADKFDREVAEVFALQDEITRQVLIELQVKLTTGESARVHSRGTKSLKAWLLRSQGFAEGMKFTREGMTKARELIQAAHEADPNWARPLAGIAWTYWADARMGWTETPDESLRVGIEFAERAIDVDPNEPLGYMMLSYIYTLKRDYDRALGYAEDAVALAPNDHLALWVLGETLTSDGEYERAVQALERAMRISPRHHPALLYTYGTALYLDGEVEKAVDSLKKLIERMPERPRYRATLAAVYADMGRIDEAKAEAATLMQAEPTFTISGYLKGQRFKDPAVIDRLRTLMIEVSFPE